MAYGFPITVTHRTTVHTQCPFNGEWDYYTVEVYPTLAPGNFLRTEQLQEICNGQRGRKASQEDLALALRTALPEWCKGRVTGQHGNNTSTVVEF